MNRNVSVSKMLILLLFICCETKEFTTDYCSYNIAALFPEKNQFSWEESYPKSDSSLITFETENERQTIKFEERIFLDSISIQLPFNFAFTGKENDIECCLGNGKICVELFYDSTVINSLDYFNSLNTILPNGENSTKVLTGAIIDVKSFNLLSSEDYFVENGHKYYFLNFIVHKLSINQIITLKHIKLDPFTKIDKLAFIKSLNSMKINNRKVLFKKFKLENMTLITKDPNY